MLISRLSKAKKTGVGQWMARCPARKDRTASLSISEKPDGIELINCFAGCEAEEIRTLVVKLEAARKASARVPTEK